MIKILKQHPQKNLSRDKSWHVCKPSKVMPNLINVVIIKKSIIKKIGFGCETRKQIRELFAQQDAQARLVRRK